MNTIKLVACLMIAGLGTASMNAQWRSEKVKGNGNVVTRTVSTSSYDEVKVVGSMDVVLSKGKEGSIGVTTDENLHEYLEIEVNGNALVLKIKDNYNIRTTKGIKITVPFEDISEVNLVGSGDVVTESTINASSFEVSVTGSGDVVLDLNAKNVDASITGSGDITLKGTTEDLEVTVTGSGDFHGDSLESEDTEVTVSGSGDAKVVARKSLKARVSGSGDIQYTGNPEKSDKKTSGSGRISAM